MMMQGDELKNTDEKNTLAENLSSHPETLDNWNGISVSHERVKKRPEAAL